MSGDGANDAVDIRDDEANRRYEITVDGELAGFAEYERRKHLIAFVHTEVDDRFEGRGLGGRLAAHALDEARANNREVLPFCHFISGYIAKHREYESLVPVQFRGEFEL